MHSIVMYNYNGHITTPKCFYPFRITFMERTLITRINHRVCLNKLSLTA